LSSIQASIDNPGNIGFGVNETVFNRIAYAVTVQTEIMPYGLLLTFTEAFQDGESIEATVTSDVDISLLPILFTDQSYIPSYLNDILMEGILMRCFKSLCMKDPKSYQFQLQVTIEQFVKLKKQLKTYIIALKSKNAFNQIQPIKFFPSEDSVNMDLGNANIPDAWTTNIEGFI
jgi:hypothetical protein